MRDPLRYPRAGDAALQGTRRTFGVGPRHVQAACVSAGVQVHFGSLFSAKAQNSQRSLHVTTSRLLISSQRFRRGQERVPFANEGDAVRVGVYPQVTQSEALDSILLRKVLCVKAGGNMAQSTPAFF